MATLVTVSSLRAQLQVAGTLYVDLRGTHPSAGSATWTNQGSLGNFNGVGAPTLATNVVGTGLRGVFFSGTNDAYQGPNSVADIDGGSDRSIEVWAYNPTLTSEETTVAWGHRTVTRRNLGFNFGSNGTWGAATHWGDDVSWGGDPPSAGAWHHLVYTYSNNVTRVYIDGALANSKTLGGPLNTFTNEPINLACQRDSANGTRSFLYSGYLNTVRIHGGVLSTSQVQSNYFFGPSSSATNVPATPTGLAAAPGYEAVSLNWNAVAGATRYNVKHAAASGGPYTNIATLFGLTNYSDGGLTQGTTYYYVVTAANLFGESANSSPVSATPGLPSQPFAAGTLYVDLRATDFSVGSAWINHGMLGDFSAVGAPALTTNVATTGIPSVTFNGLGDAFLGPNSVADLDGGSDRTIEVWGYNPSLATEETTVSWAHRGTTRRNIGFNFGNNATWGAATHWGDDVGWGTPPTANAWHHLVYTYENNLVRVYVDGLLRNTKTLGGSLNTFPNEAINLACQRESSGTRSHLYSGHLNTVRIHGGVLNADQVQGNYYFGPDAFPPRAEDDFLTLNPGAMALIPVLANDMVGSLFAAGVSIVSAPSAGTAQVKPGGKVLYTHNGGGVTADQFTYRVQNSLGETSAVATVYLTISPALRLPNATITIPNEPPPVAYQVVDAFPSLTFQGVVALHSPPGNSNQLFVVERRGVISYVPDIHAATPVRQVFLDISDQVDDSTGDTGLLGLAFHPGFSTNGFFFVFYVAPAGSPFFDRLSRFTANPTNFTVNTNTQQILINVIDEYFDHNGGDLHFGLDGYLYCSTGDEGRHYNIQQNAQRIDKDFYSGILRIDVDKKPGSLEPTPHYAIATNALGQAFYSIPPDNPFVGATSLNGQPINTNALRAEFYAIGLRHPWRISIDPANGEVWAGDVGQDRYDEVDLIVKGGNYGWAYYEASHQANLEYPTQPTLTNPPPGFSHILPLWEYSHLYVNDGGDPNFKGNAIIGGLVYHGNRLPEIDGAYVFGDFAAGNIWALRRTNSSVTIQRIAGDLGVAAFGTDPSNGDVLIASYLENKVKRLVRTDAVSSFPTKLSDTGIFADLATLTPNPGVVSYEPIVAFWSDYAIKRRWFTIPDVTNTVTFGSELWSLPSGMKWIKHFDLELERGNPNTKHRLETRVLVKTDSGMFGVSFKWNNAQTEAFLVADGGTNFTLSVQEGTNIVQQQYEIPSRAACLACHTTVGGHALSFNTREMNQVASMNGVLGNQIATLSQAGYFSAPVPNVHTLPAFATAANTNSSLEYRARSYLAVNCIQCHQPGGVAPTTWDARPYLTLAQTGLINGTPNNNGGNPTNKLIVPGDLTHSVLLQRVKGNGFARMPPLATHQLDQAAIQLLEAWISTELTNHLTFAQWQVARFGSTNDPSATAAADPDGDGANNYVEYLTATNPQDALEVWKLSLSANGSLVNLGYERVPNLGVLIESSSDLMQWFPWNVAGNQPYFGSSPGTALLQGPLSISPPYQYFRARFVEP